MNNFKALSKKEKAKQIGNILLYPLFILFGFLGKTFKLFGTKTRQITASVLTVAMILTMLPMMSLTAYAAPANPTTWSELQDAINAGGEIKLTQDIVASSSDAGLIVPEGKTVTINLYGKIIDRNATTNKLKGGVFYINGGNLTIKDTSTAGNGQITGGNSANSGGGVSLESGSFTMSGGRITKNTASYGGGVYLHEGTFTMYGGSITGNSAIICGGGVYNYQDTFTMNGGSITGNTAGEYGGGVDNYMGTFTMNGGSITGNTARLCGGGVYNTEKLNVYGGSITGNTAGTGGGVYNSGDFKVSGSATIKDNTITGSTTKSNVFLYKNYYITVTGALTGEIGVHTQSTTYPVTVTKFFYYNLTASDVAKLKSDVDGCKVALSGTVAVLQESKIDTWAKLQEAINKGGEITLTQDIVAGSSDARLTVPNGVTVTIDLYGHNIDRALTSAVDNGGVFNIAGGSLTIKDTSTAGNGQITGGNTTGDGGGVYILNGTFTMEGGSITGNTAGSESGGVHNFNGTFNMNGGSITGNTAGEYGGGVYNWKIFNVSGSATIKDNTLTDSTTKSNVYLPSDYYITVTGTLTGEIGVTTESTACPVTVTQTSTNPAYTLKASDASKLKSDVDGYEVALSGNVAVLQKTLGTLKASDFTLTPASNLTYNGNAKTATVAAKSGVSCGAITVKYYKNETLVANPTDAGAYTVKIDVAANANYKAATDLEVGTFTITQKALVKSDLTVTGIENQIYTGSAISPVPTVKFGSKTLVEGTDYTLAYGTNTAIGKGSVTVNFKNNYSGDVTYEFDIAFGTATTDMYTATKPNEEGWNNSEVVIVPKTGYTMKELSEGNWNTVVDKSYPNECKNQTNTMYFVDDASGKYYKLDYVLNIDSTAPGGDITFNTNSVKQLINTITFGWLFKDNIDVVITSSDTLSGIAKTEYYKSDSVLTEAEVNAIADWTTYNGKFGITAADKDKFVIYVKVTDNAGNITYFGSDGVTFDTAAPSVTGAVNNKTYCEAVEVTVTDDNLDTVKLDGAAVALTNGKFTVSPKAGTQTIVAADKAGNTTTITITVNDGHTPNADDDNCTTPVACKYCGEITTAAQTHNFDGAYIADGAAGHYQECQNDGCKQHSETTPHTGEDDNNCATEFKCSACGYVIKAVQTHDFTGEWKKDATNHWHICDHDGCEEIGDKAAHTWDDGEITKAATAEEKGEKTFKCIHCDATKIEPIDMLPPSMIGKTDKFVQGSQTGITFISNATFSALESVLIDDEVIGIENYATAEGSTIVTLKPAYLETLSVGKHTIEIISTTGTVFAEFTVEVKAVNSPQTGDSSNMILWIALLFVSGGAVTMLGVSKKRKKHSED